MTTFISCSDVTNRANKESLLTNQTFKPYQRHCLENLERVTANDIGYTISDSFYLWSDGYVNNGWKPFYITRTVHEGSYTYLFWKKEQDNFSLYNEIAIPKVSFERDTLFDVNGDNYKDLLIIENTMNGQCQPKFPILFCFDTLKGEFIEIDGVRRLPNPVFNPFEKTITGEWKCKMTKDFYKIKWTDRFKLDTVYHKTMKIKD